MKSNSIKTLVSVAILTATTTTAWAAGTAASTLITNKATISYKVGGVSQSDINSSPLGNNDPAACTAVGDCQTTFVVDKKVDLTVTATTPNPAPVSPGAQTQPITFSVVNTGNSTETFTMTSSQVATGTNDTFDTTGCTVVPTSQSLAPDNAPFVVTVNCNIPASSTTVKNGAKSQVDLTATVGVAASDVNVADNKDAVEVVYADGTGTADGARDGKHSAVNTYIVNAADLIVKKVSTIISDPTGQANPKRIPGAVIEYTITVENPAGGSDATDIAINDTLESNLTFLSCTPSGDGIATCSNTGNAVTTPVFTLTGGQTATLKIQATVN